VRPDKRPSSDRKSSAEGQKRAVALRALSQLSLFEEANLATDQPALGRRIRLVDATHVKEPGKTGSVWRIHYSLGWPSLRCDYFKLSASRGAGNGESLRHLPVKAGDCLLADRGYSTASGIHEVTPQSNDQLMDGGNRPAKSRRLVSCNRSSQRACSALPAGRCGRTGSLFESSI
jgi:hypothetical protein